ncbi:lipid A biosynthesis lauroyl acyltransferase [Nautilia lithotrophica]
MEQILKISPKFVKRYLKKLLTFLFYKFDTKRKKIVFVNLDLAYGNTLSKEQKEKIVKKVYENFINNLFEFIELSKMSKEDLAKKIEFENLEIVKNELQKGPVIFTGAHFGNWEISLLAIGAFITPVSAVVREIDNPKLNQRIRKIREKFNVKIYGKKGALKNLMRDLKNGRSIGILIDQNTAKEEGVDTIFFDKKVLQTPSAALLSKKFKIPIVMGFAEKKDDKWAISFKEVFICEDIQSCVDKQSKIIEEEVKKYPELWYWFHRRFKHYYEDKYE